MPRRAASSNPPCDGPRSSLTSKTDRVPTRWVERHYARPQADPSGWLSRLRRNPWADDVALATGSFTLTSVLLITKVI
jgi:hypothetical protein